MGPLWNFAWEPNGPSKIGELVMYFNGGTLQILLGALRNSNGGNPRALNKKCLPRALMVNAMAAVDLAMQGAGASAAIVLTQVFRLAAATQLSNKITFCNGCLFSNLWENYFYSSDLIMIQWTSQAMISTVCTYKNLLRSFMRSHQMETFSALLALCVRNSPVTDEFPSQKPVTQSFDVFFDLRLNKWLSKQSWGRWFQMPPHPLWRYCNVLILRNIIGRPLL